jgi:hypothetical protein
LQHKVIDDLVYFIDSTIEISKSIETFINDISPASEIEIQRDPYIFKSPHQILESCSKYYFPTLVKNIQESIQLLNFITVPLNSINENEDLLKSTTLISVNDFKLFEELISSSKGIFIQIKNHFLNFKNLTNIDNFSENGLIKLSENIMYFSIQYESFLSIIKTTYEDAFHNIFEDRKIPVFNFKPHEFILQVQSIIHSLLENIGDFSQRINILNDKFNSLETINLLERNQNAQSLIVMNQQCERRINIILAYFI